MQVRQAMALAQAEAEDLTRTVSLDASQFRAWLEKQPTGETQDCVPDNCAIIKEVVNFDSFAAICEDRYAPKDSLMRLCKNPEHPAHKTGVAACAIHQCPRMPK